ncbi:MAG: CRISPR-associated endonuclease Cas1 [Myxococcales bacterium]|nr:CRISPR-associated endonuclease Cas1 [Myxococcales bacterium]
MRSLYVVERGATLRRAGGLLQVFVRAEKRAEVVARELERLVLVGNVTLTPAAMDLVVHHGVDTVFLSHHGRFRARLSHGASSNVTLRIAQIRVLTALPPPVELAAAFVRGKVSAQHELLARIQRRHGARAELGHACLSLRAARQRLENCQTLDAVRGCEGAAAAAYFRVFGLLLRVDGFCFDGRNRRPPLDPVNALLSLGYTLLANAIHAAVEVVGLDPYVGVLHAPLAGRPSLVCDLQEEFRVPVVDAVVLAAINKGVIQPADFEDAGPGEPVVVKKAAMTTFVELFERRVESAVLHPPLGKRLTYRQVFEAQARLLARVVLGTAADYEPFQTR